MGKQLEKLDAIVGKALGLSSDDVNGEDIQRAAAEKAIQHFIALHGEEPLQSIDADFEAKVREIIGRLIAEGKLVTGSA